MNTMRTRQRHMICTRPRPRAHAAPPFVRVPVIPVYHTPQEEPVRHSRPDYVPDTAHYAGPIVPAEFAGERPHGRVTPAVRAVVGALAGMALAFGGLAAAAASRADEVDPDAPRPTLPVGPTREPVIITPAPAPEPTDNRPPGPRD